MIRAQLMFTPTESKKLIAQAVCNMDEVKQALKEGIVALHPSSSTYFIAEEILGHRPPTHVWVCGAVIPKAPCGDMLSGILSAMREEKGGPDWDHTQEFSFTWVFKRGKLQASQPLREVLEEMGPGDFYMKGVNAIDPNGNVATMIGDEVGGTIARAMAAAKRKDFQILFPTGLEKLIPTPVEQASEEGQPKSFSYSMGPGCYILPGQGKVVTEIDAIRILSGATAIPVAAGGLSGAEGSIILVVKGEQEEVDRAVAWAEKAKGAQLPRVRERNCLSCQKKTCSLVGQSKSWVVI